MISEKYIDDFLRSHDLDNLRVAERLTNAADLSVIPKFTLPTDTLWLIDRGYQDSFNGGKPRPFGLMCVGESTNYQELLAKYTAETVLLGYHVGKSLFPMPSNPFFAEKCLNYVKMNVLYLVYGETARNEQQEFFARSVLPKYN